MLVHLSDSRHIGHNPNSRQTGRFAGGPLPSESLAMNKQPPVSKNRTFKECMMLSVHKEVVKLYVDRSSQRWIVLDREGNFWIVPTDNENPWDQRERFYPSGETELEPVPGHYKHM